ncbi:hypothetical protein D3C80_1791320 [compost metagenome]
MALIATGSAPAQRVPGLAIPGAARGIAVRPTQHDAVGIGTRGTVQVDRGVLEGFEIEVRSALGDADLAASASGHIAVNRPALRRCEDAELVQQVGSGVGGASLVGHQALSLIKR